MISFERQSVHSRESGHESMFLRTLELMDAAITEQLRLQGVSDLSDVSPDVFIRRSQEDLAATVPRYKEDVDVRINAHRSIARLQNNIQGYFYALAVAIKNRKMHEQRNRNKENFDEYASAKMLEEAIIAACDNLCRVTYTQFHDEMIRIAADHGIAQDAEEYFTWRIEQSDQPLIFSLVHDSAGPRLTASDFYTNAARDQFHAWKRAESM